MEDSWSDLPQGILELILKCLSIPDRFLFGSICRSWWIAQRECPLLPFIVTRRCGNGKDGLVEIFSLSDKRIYKMLVPKVFEPYICVSSSHGWMLLSFFNGYQHALVRNKERVSIPWVKRSDKYCDCLFFSTPFDPEGVVFIRKSNNAFLFFRCFDQQFHEHQWELGSVIVSNTIFFEGKLYTLSLRREKKRKMHVLNDDYDWGIPNDGDWNLAVVDPLIPANTATLKMKMKLKLGKNNITPTLGYHVFILVESRGEILMVRMMRGKRVGGCPMCDVFRANLTTMEWMKVENLGDRMLFLSSGSSISVCASKTGCKGNRIYYAPTFFERVRGLLCRQFCWLNAAYVEFELGGEEMTTHDILGPRHKWDSLPGTSWLSPSILSHN